MYYFRHFVVPSDAYLDTFETDPNAAHVSHAHAHLLHTTTAVHLSWHLSQAFFWLRMMRHRFSDFAEADFANLAHDLTNPNCRHSPKYIADAAAFPVCSVQIPCFRCVPGSEPCRLCDLEAALHTEAGVVDADYCRFMHDYTRRMDPAQQAVACGCCGVMDVPMDTAGRESEAAGIASEPEAIGILACILRLGVSSTSFRVRQMLVAASTRSTFRRALAATHSSIQGSPPGLVNALSLV